MKLKPIIDYILSIFGICVAVFFVVLTVYHLRIYNRHWIFEIMAMVSGASAVSFFLTNITVLFITRKRSKSQSANTSTKLSTGGSAGSPQESSLKEE